MGNWSNGMLFTDPLGSRMLVDGIPANIISEWTLNPQVRGRPLFDHMNHMGYDKCLKKAKELHFEMLPLQYPGMPSSTKRLPPGYRTAMSPSQPPPPTTPKIVVEGDGDELDAGVTIDEIEDVNIRTSPTKPKPKPPPGGPTLPSSGFKGLGNRAPPGFTPKSKPPTTPPPPKLSRFMQAKRDLENSKLAKQRYQQSSRSGSRGGSGAAGNVRSTVESPVTSAPKKTKSEAEPFFGRDNNLLGQGDNFTSPIDISPTADGDLEALAALTADRATTSSVERAPSTSALPVPTQNDGGHAMVADISPLSSPGQSVANSPRMDTSIDTNLSPIPERHKGLGSPLVEKGPNGKFRPVQSPPKPSPAQSPAAHTLDGYGDTGNTTDNDQVKTEGGRPDTDKWRNAVRSPVKTTISGN